MSLLFPCATDMSLDPDPGQGLGSNTTFRSYPEATLQGTFVSKGPPQGPFLPPLSFILQALGIWSFGTVMSQGLELFPGLGTRKVINFKHHILVGEKN